MFEPVFVDMKADARREDGLAFLHGDHAARRKAASVTDTIDLKDDGPLWIARPQKIRVQAMGIEARPDRPRGGDQRLRGDEPAEDPRPTIVRRLSTEEIAIE